MMQVGIKVLFTLLLRGCYNCVLGDNLANGTLKDLDRLRVITQVHFLVYIANRNCFI